MPVVSRENWMSPLIVLKTGEDYPFNCCSRKEIILKKTRERQRANALIQRRTQHLKKKGREELIKIRNECGIKDPTPFEAVVNMVRLQDGMRAG